MKIALILFDISKIGGILTYHKNLKLGLQRNGHNVDDFFVSLNKKILPESSPYCDNVAGFMNDDMLNSFLKKLEDYDLLIFSHPCPTITRAFDSPRWMEIYKIDKPCISTIHDPFIDKYYPWFDEVVPFVDGIACLQYKAYDTIKDRYNNVTLTNHLMDLSDIGAYRNNKEDLVISPHQFKTWKNIDMFIRSIPKINGNVEVFNGGIEYHYMSGSLEKRKEKYKDPDGWIWEKGLEHGMKYRGLVSDTEITDAFKRAKCSVDLSVGELGNKLSKEKNRTLFGGPVREYKSLNYVPLETMKYGGIPIARRFSLLQDIISEDNLVLVDESDIINSTAEKVNDVIKYFDNYKDIVHNNFRLLQNEYDCKKNSQKILDLIK